MPDFSGFIDGVFGLIFWLFVIICALITAFIISHMNHDTWTHEIIFGLVVTTPIVVVRLWLKEQLKF